MITRPTTTRTGLRIGAAHRAPELPTPRGIAPQPRATGYAAPSLFGQFTRVLRALFDRKGSL